MPNKQPRIIKEAVLTAAERAGGGDLVAYLTQQARENPNAFLSLLGRIIPLQVEAPPGSAVVISSVTHVIVDAREQLEKLPLINGKSDVP